MAEGRKLIAGGSKNPASHYPLPFQDSTCTRGGSLRMGSSGSKSGLVPTEIRK
jgi:hypothetical protein